MAIKTETEVKQVVGKKRNKKQYLYALPVSLPESMVFTLFGLHTRRPSHDGFRDRCRGKLSFFYTRLTKY